MAVELGISEDLVAAELARRAGQVEAEASTEVVQSRARPLGYPSNLVLRRKIKGQIAPFLIEDTAEDVRRLFSKVTWLECRPDELVVEGSYEGAQARLYVEANSTHSLTTFELDFGRRSRWIHLWTQVTMLFLACSIFIGELNSTGDLLELLFLVALLAFFIGWGIASLSSRSVRTRACKDFETIAHRAARSATMGTSGVTEVRRRRRYVEPTHTRVQED
jgi:hypothetical protein